MKNSAFDKSYIDAEVKFRVKLIIIKKKYYEAFNIHITSFSLHNLCRRFNNSVHTEKIFPCEMKVGLPHVTIQRQKIALHYTKSLSLLIYNTSTEYITWKWYYNNNYNIIFFYIYQHPSTSSVQFQWTIHTKLWINNNPPIFWWPTANETSVNNSAYSGEKY